MSNLVRIFEGQEIIIRTDKGEKLINLGSTARSCGITTVANSRNEVIRWKGKGSVYEKLEKLISINTGKQNQNKSTSVDKKYLEKIESISSEVSELYKKEIKYILSEIENADDRNLIYMSSWLSKRLALECHSEKAMRYKNFLVTLDEQRENGQDNAFNESLQILRGSLPMFEQIMTNIVPAISEIKNQVNHMAGLIHAQSAIYDQDREDLKSLIGLRTSNTMSLSAKLKERIYELFQIKVTANSPSYIKGKNKTFRQFKVTKWEDISVAKYNAVYAFIDSLEKDDLVSI